MAEWYDDDEQTGAWGSASRIPVDQWFPVRTDTGEWQLPGQPPTLASSAGMPDVNAPAVMGGLPDQAPLAIGQVAGGVVPSMTTPASMARVARADTQGLLAPQPGVWESIARGIGMASPLGRAYLQSADQQQQQGLQNRLALRRQQMLEDQETRQAARDDFTTFADLSKIKSKSLRNLAADRWAVSIRDKGGNVPQDLLDAFKKAGLEEGEQMAQLLSPYFTQYGLDPTIASKVIAEGGDVKDLIEVLKVGQEATKIKLTQQETQDLEQSRQRVAGPDTLGGASGVTPPAPATGVTTSPTTPTSAVPAPSGQPVIDQAITDATRLYPQVRPALAHAIVRHESNYDPTAVSPKGAIGPMQLMPGTAKDMGVDDPKDPTQNVRGGTRYFAQMLTKYGGNEALALAAYNWGPGNVDKVNGDITKMPAETQAYVKNVLGTAASGQRGPAGTQAQVAGPGAPSQDQAKLAALDQRIAAMDQEREALAGRGGERTRAYLAGLNQRRDELMKLRDQLTEAPRAGGRAAAETRARTGVERELRGETTLAEAFKGDTPNLYDTQTGQQLDARMKVKDYEAQPPGRSRMLSSAQREQMENVNASVPIIAQLQTHIDKIYGPGGVLAKMTPDDRSLITSGTPLSQRLLDQFAQRYPELIQAQRFIDANAGALARSLAGEKGAMAEGDVERARAMLPSLITSLKVWPLSQIGVHLPDTRGVALRQMNSIVDMINARARTLLGNEQYAHPKLHRYQTAEEAQQQTGTPGPTTTRPRPQDIAPEGKPAVGLNPNWRAPGTPPPPAPVVPPVSPGQAPTAQAAPAPTPTPPAATSGQRALRAMTPAQLRQIPDALARAVIANPGMEQGLSSAQLDALAAGLEKWERSQARR